MRATTALFQINGQPMLLPDAQVGMSYEDLDSADAGRDESGYMHRKMVRRKVGVWSFSYSHLTGAQYRYMLSVLPQGGTFSFTYPDPENPGSQRTTTAYVSAYSVVWHSARTDTYRNLQGSVIEC